MVPYILRVLNNYYEIGFSVRCSVTWVSKQGGGTHLWQEFDSFMYDNMIDDTSESYWAITDKKDHKQYQKLWFSALVLLAYGNAIAQN